MSSSEPRTTIEGTLEQFTYVNAESAWSVVKIAVTDRAGPVTVVGNLLGVQLGENLRLRGSWTMDRRFGEQFRAESYESVAPSTLDGMERYLASGLVPGIGKALAKRIVARFGLETLEVIQRTPARLREVPGVGAGRLAKVTKAWGEQREVREVMLFLQAHGVSTAYAIRIYKRYRSSAIAVVKANPYRLAEDIYGIGFVSADRIARNLGVSASSPERARAGLLHVLTELSAQGHVFQPRSRLFERARELLGIDLKVIEEALQALVDDDRVVLDSLLSATEAGGDTAVYLRSMYAAEAGAASLAAGLLARASQGDSASAAAAITRFEARERITLAPEQREAILRALATPFLVITGGPGTGKTTLVKGLISILEERGRRVLLAAPTGRAAKRMAEATGREAKTLHRLLEFDPVKRVFRRDKTTPLEADAVIVDESSMVDIVLAYDVLKAIPPGCQFVMVGDVDQLPSVGPGSVLKDTIRSGTVQVVRLQRIFRQAEKSLIVVNAHRVNRGEVPRVAPEGEVTDFFFIEKEAPEAILSAVKQLVAERIPARFGMDPIQDIQVLAPMHRGVLGVGNLNAELQALRAAGGPALPFGGRTFRLSDKVMQIRNAYEKNVFNGDIGRVVRIDEEDRALAVNFDGAIVEYEAGDLDELTLAYACSIHKSQGSEYPCVVLPLHSQHFVMLQRNLLYTALTRAKRLAIIVGSRRAVEIAVRTAKTDGRFTQFAERLASRLRR